MDSSPVCGTIQADGAKRVHRRYATHLVLHVVEKRLGQGMSVHFINDVQRAVGICSLIHALVDVFPQKVVMVQKVNMNGLFSVIGYKRVPLIEIWHRGTHRRGANT